MMNGVFGMEKPVIFPYDEILIATDEFTEKNHLGAGAYGSVFQGKLRGQVRCLFFDEILKLKIHELKIFFYELTENINVLLVEELKGMTLWSVLVWS